MTLTTVFCLVVVHDGSQRYSCTSLQSLSCQLLDNRQKYPGENKGGSDGGGGAVGTTNK